MKAYVIITLNLCAMHGANMYLYNKVRYLKDKGYEVYLFSAEQGEIVIPGLKEYERYQSPYLRFYPACFTKKKVGKFIRWICDEIKAEECSEIIVESTNIYSALWGEILSRELNCKHLAIILQERFGYTKPERDFLRFKLDRRELAGINDEAVGKMLEDETIPVEDNMKISAYCNNTIDECKDEISPKLRDDAALTIGSIGRLEKKYVLPLSEALCDYCKKHSDSFYNIVFIGGTREAKQIQRIKNVFADCSNVNLILPGLMFPIPRSFVDKCDVFISAAGSAWATHFCERPTVFLNPGTGDIIGIVGLTCMEGEFSIYTSNYQISEIGDMIELAIEKKDEIKYKGILNDGSYKKEMDDEFDRQMGFLELNKELHFYDAYSVKFADRSYRPFNILGKFVNVNILYKGLVAARKSIK